jgi:tetratricopeptide (TPR) repeat protein
MLRENLMTIARIGRLERLGMPAPPSVLTLGWLSHCLSELGELDEAAALADEVYEAAQQDGRPYTLCLGLFGRAYVAAMRADLSAATSFERGIEIAQTHGVQWALNLATGGRGWVLTASGRSAEGRPLLEQGVALLERHGQFPGSALFRGWLARAVDGEGDSARALELARQAVDQAAAQQQRGIHAWNRWHLAAILARAGDPDAESTFREALAAAEERGMRPLQAHCHLGLGRLYRHAGRLDEARAELATAVAMLREMGMAFWLPEAEEELMQAADRASAPSGQSGSLEC